MIIRTPKNRDNPYVMINKFALGDPGLTMAAKGLLAYLLSLPDDWVVRPKELVNHFKNGRDAIYSTIKELIEAGYLRRSQTKDSKNQFRQTVYDVSEIPSLVYSVLNSVRHPRIRKVRTRGTDAGLRAITKKLNREGQLKTISDLTAIELREEGDNDRDAFG